jgi:hypothetical protein
MICSSLNLLRFIPSDFTQNRSHFRRARQRTAALIWQAAAKSQSAPRIERQPSRPALPNFYELCLQASELSVRLMFCKDKKRDF